MNPAVELLIPSEVSLHLFLTRRAQVQWATGTHSEGEDHSTSEEPLHNSHNVLRH